MNKSQTPSLFTGAPHRRLLERRLNRFGRCVALLAALAVPLGQAAWAASGIWQGTTDATWAGANWSAAPVPGTGDTATFNASSATVNAQTTIDLGGGVTINTILFDTSNAATYTIGAGAVNSQTLTLNNGGAVTMNSTVANNELFNAAIVLGTDKTAQTYTLTNNSTTNSLTFAGTITGNNGSGTAGIKTLSIAGAGNMALNGIISNGGASAVALTKSGGGTLTLVGANTYTGTTTLNGGTLVGTQTSGTPFGTGAMTLNGGTLSLAPAGSGSNVSLTGGTLAAATNFTLNAGNNVLSLNEGSQTSLTYTFGGTGATFVRNAGSSLIITESAAGTLGSTTGERFIINGTAPAAEANNANLVFAPMVLQTSPTDTTGNFLLYGANGFASTAANYTNINGAQASPNLGNLIWDVTGASSVTGTPTNQLAALRVGATTLTIGSAAAATSLTIGNLATTETAQIILNGGTIAPATAGSTTQALAFGASEGTIYTSAANGTISSAITGSGGLTTFGPGTLTLSGKVSYTGGTTVDGGVLTLAGTFTGGGGLTVKGGATVNLNAATTVGTIALSPTAGSVAILNVNAAYTAGNNGIFEGGVANGGISVLNIAANAGWTTSGARFSAGDTAANFGVANITAGAVTPGGSLIAGNAAGAVGIFNISGGSVSENTTTTAGFLGNNATGTGVLNVTGAGTFTSNNGNANSGLYVGNSGAGVLNVAGSGSLTLGGGVAASKGLDFAQGATTGNGIVNLGAVSGGGSGGSGGGTITTNVVQMGTAGASIFNFHGGTLKATPTNVTSAFFTGLTSAYVWNEGGTVDNNGQSITIGQALLAPTGSGVNALTLSGGTGFTPGATPLVTISGGAGTGATAIANVTSGGVLSLTITNPGMGYTSAPTVTLTGATGAASATATIGANSSGGLTFQGTGTTALTGANSYSGGTTVSGGTVTVGSGGTLGATTGTLVVSNPNTGAGTAVVLNLPTATGLTAGSLSGAIATPSSGSNTATINTQSGQTFTINQTSPGTYAGVIAGSGNFALGSLSTNALTLSGVNTYSGTTTVNSGGTLIVNGSLTGSTATVNGGAALAGTGTIAPTASSGAAVTINGALTPDAPSTVGNINFTLQGTAALAFGASSTLNLTLNNTGGSSEVAFTSTPGAGEWLSGAGNATLALNGTINYADTYTIFHNAIFTGYTGAFTFANITGYDAGSFTPIFAQVGNDYDLSFVAVPEPETWAMMFGGAGMLVAIQRMRRRNFKTHGTL